MPRHIQRGHSLPALQLDVKFFACGEVRVQSSPTCGTRQNRETERQSRETGTAAASDKEKTRLHPAHAVILQCTQQLQALTHTHTHTRMQPESPTHPRQKPLHPQWLLRESPGSPTFCLPGSPPTAGAPRRSAVPRSECGPADVLRALADQTRPDQSQGCRVRVCSGIVQFGCPQQKIPRKTQSHTHTSIKMYI